MLLELLLAILGLVGFGRILYFRYFPVVIAGFVLLLFLLLVSLFAKSRFSWAIFFLAAIVNALYLFLKGFLSITLLLFFVVNILGLIVVFVRSHPVSSAQKKKGVSRKGEISKQLPEEEKPRVEIIPKGKPGRRKK